MIDLPDLLARIRLDTSDLEKGAKRAAGFGGAIGGAIGGVAGTALASGVAQVKAFATGAVDAFARVEDATGAAGVQFGDALPQVVEFAEGAAQAFGISEGAALDAANTFGTIGKAAGKSGPDLAEFSTDLTGLAGDLASFKGTSTEQAIGAIGAALRGEAEPIRAYGVLLDDASLRAKALELGLIKTTKDALTPQSKALATQALIFAKTKDAQGDYARTSDSTANTQKTLAAETENAQVALGEKLAPAVTALRRGFLGAIKGLTGFIDDLDPVIARAGEAAEVFGDDVVPVLKTLATTIVKTVRPPLEFIVENFETIAAVAAPLGAAFVVIKGALLAQAAATKIVAAVTKGFTAVQAALNIVLGLNPIVLVVAGLAALGVALVLAYKKSETFRDIVNGVWKAVQSGIGNLVGVALQGFRFIVENWLRSADAIVSGAATALGWVPGLGPKLKQANAAFDRMKDGILDTLDEAADRAYGFGEDSGSNAASGLRSTQTKAFNAGATVARDMGRGVGSGSGAARAAGVGVGVNAAQGLIDGLAKRRLAVAKAAQQLAAEVGRAMQTGLQERSPSKVTRRIGEFAGEGLALGLEDLQGRVSKASAALAVAATPDLPDVRTLGLSGAVSGARQPVRGSTPATPDPALLAALQRPVQVLLDGRVIAEVVAAPVAGMIGKQTNDYLRAG